jgi:hypothetical protein
MKTLYLRSSLALACALTLAACGGDGDGNLSLGGQAYGVTATGLVLTNNGAHDLIIAPGTSYFEFPDRIGSDTNFDVQIKSPPSNATCQLTNNKGKTGAYSITSIQLVCTLIPHNLSGKVSGLKNPGLVIINGSDRLAIAPNATTFTMTLRNEKNEVTGGQVGQSLPYGITIFTQPAGQTCSVANGIGTMGTTDIDNVQITCI